MDVFVLSILVVKSARDDSKICESFPQVQVIGVDVGCHNSVELHDTKALSLCLLQAVAHKFFADVKPARAALYCVTCIGDMADAADVVGVQNVQTDNFSVHLGDAAVHRAEEFLA